jgi:hypothetical protein
MNRSGLIAKPGGAGTKNKKKDVHYGLIPGFHNLQCFAAQCTITSKNLCL